MLERSVPALLATDGMPVEVLIVNNDAEQDVSAWVRQRSFPCTRAIDMGYNAGLAGASNRGYRESVSPYVFFCNQDTFVTPGFLPALVHLLEKHPNAGSAVGKLLRWDAPRAAPGSTIDSTGIVVRRSRGSFDRGEGRPDHGQFHHTEQVFGGSAAALLARRSALADVVLQQGPFDESFFMYKEELDLAWRLRLRGWECWYVPAAIAYHERSSRGLNGDSVVRSPRRYLANQRAKPLVSRRHSMKNEWLTLLADESAGTLARDFPFILARQLLALVANFALGPRMTLAGVGRFARATPSALRKRRHVQRSAVVPPMEVRAWFLGKQRS